VCARVCVCVCVCVCAACWAMSWQAPLLVQASLSVLKGNEITYGRGMKTPLPADDFAVMQELNTGTSSSAPSCSKNAKDDTIKVNGG
jgi:hypothetical protein